MTSKRPGFFTPPIEQKPRLFSLQSAVRKGKVTVKPREVPSHVGQDAWGRYVHELREGIHYLRDKRHVVLLGISWAIFIASMLTQGVTTAPLSDRILHAGAKGYGWLNAGWAIGAFTSALYAPLFILLAARPAVGRVGNDHVSLERHAGAVIRIRAACSYVLCGDGIRPRPRRYRHFLCDDGNGAEALHGARAEYVFLCRTLLQLVTSIGVGVVAETVSLALAFAIIGVMYGVAAVTAAWPVAAPVEVPAERV